MSGKRREIVGRITQSSLRGKAMEEALAKGLSDAGPFEKVGKQAK